MGRPVFVLLVRASVSASLTRAKEIAMTDWKETIKARSGYVLYLEHDEGPHNVSIHDSLSVAEAALREIASGILAAGDEDLPDNDRDIVGKLAEYGEYARIYKCDADDGDAIGRVLMSCRSCWSKLSKSRGTTKRPTKQQRNNCHGTPSLCSACAGRAGRRCDQKLAKLAQTRVA
jgi:hypothetical protein